MFSENAYAKVNLSLLITGKRQDGYHLLDTVMQTVSLSDVITVKDNEEIGIKVICDNSSIDNKENICYKAAELFFERTDIKRGVTIEINKNIPLAAGLGGGSADAAAVLRILNKLYAKPLSYDQLCEIGLKLGADVPFCINGGCARVKGIGEEIKKIPSKLKLYIVLVKDALKASTGQMYGDFDKLNRNAELSDISGKMEESLCNGDYGQFCEAFYNDFSLVSNYSYISKRLIELGADAVSLSGSGPTVMGIFSSKEKADSVAQLLDNEYKFVFSCENV
ncbi:MAG: 4-(cytidine 5'-diphospho)-2-C-methyl-D-erythritol kinase [Acutalibacteraceae bacterium]|nr:4-(cytidine 5'-diphospho)-2-C-methyl-D-erythritol kinase [Acutalibacteraceae bacterium]